ncbi:tRNA (adenosine(37)-N6)-threonylcarbamoyltransferase complex ATPase subunit type 1 TsaE [Candidatus Saccharibacteria bacterium]|nr:tRNA (adenosine(37)-N6)-threonylcarbamoyltransferase complex ATPase subunit type 1 TsaE [Candidatus Saccharibacteria bacterium]
MIVKTEEKLAELAAKVGKKLNRPAVLELTGDVGAGKTTFTRALAKSLGVKEPVTSPSFSISKRYALPEKGELIHYDFYRLEDPGIMSFELEETLSEPDSIIVIEWGESVAGLLPDNRLRINFTILENNARKIEMEPNLL